MELSNLPNELLVLVAEFVDDEFSINALLQTCKRFPPLLNPCLYELNVRYSHSCALEWGAKNGYEATVRRSLQAGASPSSAHYEPWVPMALACIHGHEAVVRVLLEYGVNPISETMDVWYKDPRNRPLTGDEGSPPILAAAQGHEKVVDLLLSSGVPHDIRCKGWHGIDISPLSMAARNGHIFLVKLFISLGSDIQIEGLHGSIIADAANEGHCEVVQFLLETNPQLCSPDVASQALCLAASEGDIDIVKLLLEYGIVPTPTLPTGRSYPLAPLVKATQMEHYEVVEKLLEYMNLHDFVTYGEPDDEDHRRLLLVSAACGWRDIVEILLERGCSSDFFPPKSLAWKIRQTLPDGRRVSTHGYHTSPLALAAHRGHGDIVDLLLDHNDRPEVLNSLLNERCPNPLFAAIDGNHLKIANTLLNHGANPNIRMGGREPVFFKAVQAPEILKLLFDHGLDLALRSSDSSVYPGVLIYERALCDGNLATLDLLQQKYSFKRHQHTERRHSIDLLDCAMQGGALAIEYLLNNGFEVMPGSSEARNAFEYALYRSDTASLTLMFERGLVPSKLSIPWNLEIKHSLLGLVSSPNSDTDQHAMAATVDMLIAHGCQINGDPALGYPLNEALHERKMALCQLLLDKGANPLHKCGQSEGSPLANAVRKGYRKEVRAMLQILDRRNIPLEELREELQLAEQHFHSSIAWDDVRPLIRRFYWRKRYPVV
ncbi:hypothetical protein N7456_000346 [Penicillium angulare]|uniref:F-box domain-containing protein n=1 Tax=Penicillium angulare TaxID=116970 RepID=A0A9W9KRT8_9EURO|nr:hypothetical protein N7456_000346 [Penicillium angulare]